MSPKNLKSLEGEPGLKVVHLPDTVCNFLCMNTKKAFRQREGASGDQLRNPYSAIIPNVLYGYGDQMKSPVASQTPGYDGSLSPYKYDIAKAKAAMQEASVAGGPFAVNLAVRVGYEPHEQVCVGSSARTREDWVPGHHREGNRRYVSAVVIEARPSAFDSSWQSWINDPIYHMFWNFHSKAVFTNKGFYSIPAIDKLLDDNIREGVSAKARRWR